MNKKVVLPLILILLLFSMEAVSQCSLCTKTAQQLGEKPAQGMNQGIIYLMMTPLAIAGVIGFRWWRNNRHEN